MRECAQHGYQVSTTAVDITEYILTYDGKPSYTLSIMEFRGEKTARKTQYFATPSRPPHGALNGSSGSTHSHEAKFRIAANLTIRCHRHEVTPACMLPGHALRGRNWSSMVGISSESVGWMCIAHCITVYGARAYIRSSTQ